MSAEGRDSCCAASLLRRSSRFGCEGRKRCFAEQQAQGMIVYRENKPFVRRALGAGKVDYIDLTKWSFADHFFAFLSASGFLAFAQASYPTPRVKEEVPVWFLIACAVQLKLHCQSAFLKLKHLLQSGAIMSRLRFNVGMREGGGFNGKNRNERQCMVDQDTVRKFYRDTPAVRLFRWFNVDVARWLHKRGAFDKEGHFICDLTHVPVPDNPKYKHVVRLPLDENGDYMDLSALTAEQKKLIRYTPCYALVSLMHVLPGDRGHIYAGAYLAGGSADEVRTARRLVRNFTQAAGKGVIKLLIVDRGFIDGSFVTEMKRKYRIDLLIPLRSNMQALEEALRLIEHSGSRWSDYNVVRDREGNVVKTEQVAGVGNINVWDGCEVPLYVAVMRVTHADGAVDYWGLASPRHYKDPSEAFNDYKERTGIEERHRQIKGFWNLAQFSSTAFNLIAVHVYFILLVYSLVQLYLNSAKLSELTNQTIDSLRHEERLGLHAAIVYAGRYFATFDLDEYSDILLHLRPAPLERMRKWIKLFRSSKTKPPP